MPCDLVLLAMGFLGPERHGMLEKLGVRLTERGNVWRDASWMTSVPGVFTAGDMQRGQSLIVWAIAEGQARPGASTSYLMGRSDLPTPSPGPVAASRHSSQPGDWLEGQNRARRRRPPRSPSMKFSWLDRVAPGAP